MTNKKQSNESTFIYTGDTSIGSLGISRIEPTKTHYGLKGLSFSLENLRNPFPQTLPLKFPKKRIIRGGKSHMLEESIQPVHRPCFKPSEIRNKHNIEVQPKKGIKITHKTNLISEDNNIYQTAHHSTSHSNSVNQSLQKRSKRIFHHMVMKESSKDPILVGETNGSVSRGKRQFQNSSQKKNVGQGLKSSLDWKVNKSEEKIKFNNMCKVVPTFNLTNLNSDKKIDLTQRKTQRNAHMNTGRNTQRVVREAPMTSRNEAKPKSYLEMYNSRRIGLK